jgi:uncharacterized lipoprotein YmbA
MFACALLGCASPEAPRPALLTVSAAPPAAGSAAPSPATGRTVIVLRRVELPEYLLARRVRYRESASLLAEWPDTVWAERMEIGITRELAAALRQRLPGWTLCDGACADGLPGEVLLYVDFSALDLRRASSRLQVAAHAQSTHRGAAAWDWSQSFETPVRADTPQAHADAIGAALGTVADALAARLRSAP